MIRTAPTGEVERFRRTIARSLGLHFEDDRLGHLADVLRRRLDALGQSADAYLPRAEAEISPDEAGALAQELTVSETYFFRNGDQFRALSEIALPERIAARSAARCLRILSAGCASGEEAYSIAILVRQVVDPSWDVLIFGVDLNPAMVRRAKRARYSAWSLRETPPEIRHRFFTSDNREFLLDPCLRAAVRFETRNIAADDPHLWRAGTYDIVFFRNVLMYLTPETGRAVVARISRALCPGGYLFLGHAETLRGLSGDFHLEHTHGTFYYRRRYEQQPSASRSVASGGVLPEVVAAVESGSTWIDAIRRATERIGTLSGALPSRAPSTRVPAADSRGDLGVALELLREERFTEAIETMRRLPAESARDPDVLLLSATLQAHRGRLTEAEDACRRLLEVDELSAGAHYLLALCREGAGDAAQAAYHDRVAIHLDPGFAMPHLHLGLLARRAGDRATAHRELEQALLLLEREDGSRLLLFGGGFGRPTLLALCRAELVGCGTTA